MGHEGKNSLLSELIKQELALSLSSGPSLRLNSAITEFHIDVSLTEKGNNDFKRVIEVIYMFINKIKEEGPQKHIYEEFSKKYKIDFENQTK